MLLLEKARVPQQRPSAAKILKIFKKLICHPGILARWQDMPLAYVQTHSAQVQ